MNDKIHILFFAASLGGGGAEMHLSRVVNRLDRDKFQVSLAVARPHGSYERSLASDVQLHHLSRQQTSSITLQLLRAVKPLRRIIQAARPDIVCAVMGRANNVAVCASAALRRRPKIVLSVQNPPSIQYQSSRHPFNRLSLSLNRRLYQKADQIVALSKGVETDLLKFIPNLRVPVTTIPNAGMDMKVLEDAVQPLSSEELLDKRPLIVACGRLTEQKGFCYLIDAISLVRNIIPCRLWIIGEGKLRDSLQHQIQRLGLDSCVRLLGFQENPYKYMAAARVFVLSSVYEGFGNVIVEAMACGAPIVATDCPHGPREIIRPGIDGLLVPPRDVNALATAIGQVLQDRELASRLSDSAKMRAQDFDATVIAAAHGELFQRLVERPVPTCP